MPAEYDRSDAEFVKLRVIRRSVDDVTDAIEQELLAILPSRVHTRLNRGMERMELDKIAAELHAQGPTLELIKDCAQRYAKVVMLRDTPAEDRAEQMPLPDWPLTWPHPRPLPGEAMFTKTITWTHADDLQHTTTSWCGVRIEQAHGRWAVMTRSGADDDHVGVSRQVKLSGFREEALAHAREVANDWKLQGFAQV